MEKSPEVQKSSISGPTKTTDVLQTKWEIVCTGGSANIIGMQVGSDVGQRDQNLSDFCINQYLLLKDRTKTGLQTVDT